MSNTITPLANLLHKFNSQTIQRSLDYVSHIDLDSLDRTETSDNIVLKADVEGSEDNIYRTSVTFNKQNHRIIDSRCSCPVGSFCKHAGALARLLRDNESKRLQRNEALAIGQSGLLENLLQSMVYNANLAPNQQKSMDELLIEVQQQKNKLLANPLADPVFNKQTYDEANLWLKNLRQHLTALEKTKKNPSIIAELSPFIYLIEHKFGQLQLELVKVRRIKSGEIREAKTYTQYSNIYYSYSLPITTKALFTQIYDHVKTQDRAVFSQYFMIANELPLNLLQQLIKDKILYDKTKWDNNWKEAQFHPMTWTDEVLTLEIEWLANHSQQGEKLQFNLLDQEQHRYGFGQKENLDVLFTQPLTFINHANAKIGLVNTDAIGDMPNDVLYRLMTMPPIPSDLVTEVDEVFSKSPVTQQLPKPKAVQNIESLYGIPQPIVHFSTADDINVPWQYRSELREGTWIQKKLVLAELSFAYEGGETVANTDEFFIGKKDGNKVRQYQDKDFEKQAIKAFRKLFSSFNWLKNGTINSKFKAVIEVSDVLSALLPTDKIADIGWQVEHLPDSPVNV